MRLVFMGTPDFAVAVLAALVEAGHDVARVYSQPPRPAGRGHRERPSPVQAFAEARGLPVSTPRSLRDPEAQAEFAALGAEAAVVAAYGLILPRPILAAPRHGCLNVHASLLPRWRGAAPIQRAIMAGDTETGVTIMQMDAGLDTGPMLRSARVPIGPRTTAGELHDTLAALGARLMVEVLADVAAGRAHPLPQPAEGVTYAAKIAREDERIDWRRPAAEVDRLVRGLSPHPGAWFAHHGERIKVLEGEPAAGEGDPGTVLGDGLVVACGHGAYRPLRVQRAGRAVMDTGDFLRGFPLAPGTVLG